MRLSRNGELCLAVSLLVCSIIGLSLVIHYAIIPEMVHKERLHLRYFPPEQVDFYDRQPSPTRPDPKDSPVTNQNRDVEAPLWLVLSTLLTVPGQLQQRITISLPYGAATDSSPQLSFHDAGLIAAAFMDTLPVPNDKPLWVDERDWNNAFFNYPTNASVPDYSSTYPGDDPDHPTLVIYETTGEGVTVGAGFLLTLSVVGIVLSIMWLGLRIWDDFHPPAMMNVMSGGGGGPESPRRDFNQLADGGGMGMGMGMDMEEESQALRLSPEGGHMHSSHGMSQHHSRSRSDGGDEHIEFGVEDGGGDIELQETRQNTARGSSSRSSRDRNDIVAPAPISPPSRSSQSSSTRRHPIPTLHPPPSSSPDHESHSDDHTMDDHHTTDEELASFEEDAIRAQQEEVMRHQQQSRQSKR